MDACAFGAQNGPMVLRWLLALLVVTTLLGLFANEHWMTRRLALDGRGPGQQAEVVDDSGSGGASHAELVTSPDGAQTIRIWHPLLRAPANQMTVPVNARGAVTLPVTVKLRAAMPMQMKSDY